MSVKLSVFIIALNAEQKIAACLKSVQWADEIVVVDSGSVDRTPEIVRAHGARYFSHPFVNFSDQKNFAMNLCSGDWLFSIDSDEVVTEALKAQIQQTMVQADACSAYQIRRRSMIFGREFHFSGTQKDCPTRLFKKGLGHFEQPIHEYLAVQGSVGELSGPLMHFTYSDTKEYFVRFERYTTAEAEYMLQKNSPLSWIDFTLRPAAVFFKLYVAQQGFRDGKAGFLFCLFSSRYVMVKYSKYRKLKQHAQAASPV